MFFKNPGSRMLMSTPLGRLRKTQCFIKVKIYFIWWTLYKLHFGLKDQVRILVVPNEPTRITNICPEWACEYKMFENLVLIFLQLQLSSVGRQLTFFHPETTQSRQNQNLWLANSHFAFPLLSLTRALSMPRPSSDAGNYPNLNSNLFPTTRQ